MSDLQKLIAVILPDFWAYLNNAETSEKPKKGLDMLSNPSIDGHQGEDHD